MGNIHAHIRLTMRELLRTPCEEAKMGNSSIKQQVRDIGNKFLNNVEISAQEAVYIVLQLPMRKSSRQVVFINTSPPEDRVQLLKPRGVYSSIIPPPPLGWGKRIKGS